MSLQFGAFVFRGKEKEKKWISIPSHHHSPDGAGHERVCVCLCVCVCVCVRAWEKTGACVCGGEAWERGLHVEIEMDQLKHNIGLIF